MDGVTDPLSKLWDPYNFRTNQLSYIRFKFDREIEFGWIIKRPLIGRGRGHVIFPPLSGDIQRRFAAQVTWLPQALSCVRRTPTAPLLTSSFGSDSRFGPISTAYFSTRLQALPTPTPLLWVSRSAGPKHGAVCPHRSPRQSDIKRTAMERCAARSTSCVNNNY